MNKTFSDRVGNVAQSSLLIDELILKLTFLKFRWFWIRTGDIYIYETLKLMPTLLRWKKYNDFKSFYENLRTIYPKDVLHSHRNPSAETDGTANFFLWTISWRNLFRIWVKKMTRVIFLFMGQFKKKKDCWYMSFIEKSFETHGMHQCFPKT